MVIVVVVDCRCFELVTPLVSRCYGRGIALVETLSSMLEVPLSFLMTAGDVGKWRDTPEPEKRLLLGRRLAQVHPTMRCDVMLCYAMLSGEVTDFLCSVCFGSTPKI